MTGNYGTECPACGSTRSLVYSASLDARGHRIRMRHCEVCPEKFPTVEVAIPFSYWEADALTRERHGERGVPRREPDGFLVRPTTREASWSVRLIKGQKLNTCRKGLHELEGENVYNHPSGQRVCKPCRREKMRASYANRMSKMPASLRDELREDRRRKSAERVDYKREWARRKREAA
jgi:hypothetical protein